ncbi:hypothetical protein [Demequina sp.]|uniref:hypothetical protein n=1 Tax=Demequina sp. TaxID=2050685 RepID=UPI003D107723
MHRRLALVTASLLAVAGCSAPTALPSVEATATMPSGVVFAPGITTIDCGADAHDPTAVVVLSDDLYRVGGWNHINGVGSFETVALEPSQYAITAKNYLPDATCGNAKTLPVVLAKKTYDWDQQHANGIESQFASDGLTFGAVDAIVLEMRLDAATSSIPQPADYEAAYGDLLTADQLSELDGGKVNLELTLFGSGAAAGDPSMNAGTIIEVDPAAYGDEWIRVVVPREDLTFYTEQNYERTAVADGVNADLVVSGLRINPETSSGNEVRVYVGDAFDPLAKPELFKEMGMTFAVIEVLRAGS